MKRYSSNHIRHKKRADEGFVNHRRTVNFINRKTGVMALAAIIALSAGHPLINPESAGAATEDTSAGTQVISRVDIANYGDESLELNSINNAGASVTSEAAGDITAESESDSSEAIKNISLQVGANETRKNITWLAKSNSPAYVQLAVKPEGWSEKDKFPEDEAKAFRASQKQASTKSGTDSNYVANRAVMKNLQENTSYIYRVGNDEAWSETYNFSTADLGDGDSFSFLFAGDPQIGASHNNETDTAGWIKTLDYSTEKFPDTGFILSAGDQINDKVDGNDVEQNQWDGYLAPEEMQEYASAYNEGNHDSGSLRYSDHNYNPNVSNLGSKSDSGSFSGDYWYTYNGVLFMSINSNVRSTAQHRAFLKQAIAENPNAKWRVVSFHHSVFSSATHATDGDILERRSELPDVFSDLDIDAVLMGHDHVYTRTYMMDGNEPIVPEGHDVSKGQEAASAVTDPADGEVFYLTANSASGSKYYKMNTESLTDFIAVKDQSNRPNITNVEVTDDSMTFTTYFTDTEKMEKLDEFTINKTSEYSTDAVKAEFAKSAFTYTGKAIKPAVTVTAKDGSLLKEGTDYTLAYDSDSKSIGTHKVSVNMTGKYSGSKELTYEIIPASTKITKAKAGKKKITLKLKKLNGGVKYEIQYRKAEGSSSTDTASGTSAAQAADWYSKYVKSAKATLKKLTKKQKYEVRARAYKSVNGKTYCGAWTKVKTVRVK